MPVASRQVRTERACSLRLPCLEDIHGSLAEEKGIAQAVVTRRVQADVRMATQAFRNERLNEPLDLYNQFFDQIRPDLPGVDRRMAERCQKPGQRQADRRFG